jgi:hypothetical protein
MITILRPQRASSFLSSYLSQDTGDEPRPKWGNGGQALNSFYHLKITVSSVLVVRRRLVVVGSIVPF